MKVLLRDQRGVRWIHTCEQGEHLGGGVKSKFFSLGVSPTCSSHPEQVATLTFTQGFKGPFDPLKVSIQFVLTRGSTK